MMNPILFIFLYIIFLPFTIIDKMRARKWAKSKKAGK